MGRCERSSCPLSGRSGTVRAAGGFDGSTPRGANGESQRISGISRLGYLRETKNPPHHLPHLRLVSGAVAGHRCLHLGGGAQFNRDAPTISGNENHPGDLRDTHHRADVVLGEDPLERDLVGGMLVDGCLDGIGNGAKSRCQIHPRIRARAVNVDELQRAEPINVNDPDPTSSEAGVNAENSRHAKT